MAEYARPFRLHRYNGQVLHGAEFPSGRVVVETPAGIYTAVSLDELLAGEPSGTRVERPEEDSDA